MTSSDHFDYMDEWHDGGIDLTGEDIDPWRVDDAHE